MKNSKKTHSTYSYLDAIDTTIISYCTIIKIQKNNIFSQTERKLKKKEKKLKKKHKFLI